jgi:hypothetical protein
MCLFIIFHNKIENHIQYSLRYKYIFKMTDQDSIKTKRSKKSDKASKNFALNGAHSTKHVRLVQQLKEKRQEKQ